MIHLNQGLLFPLVAKCLLNLPDRYFDRYENPFERKYTLRDKENAPECVEKVFTYLDQNIKLAEGLFGLRLAHDQHRHYHGIFLYMPGDELKVHADAGIHPISGLRKHVTALLYLNDSGGDLEFWNGSSCVSDFPYINLLKQSVSPQEGSFVMFNNTDYSWHGVTENNGKTPRIVATVSYLSADIDAFQNMRQRAYFVPRPTERWSHETIELRNKRSDPEKYAEVYRV